MVSVLIKNSKVTRLVQKTYSDSEIINYFSNNFNLKYQLSLKFQNNPIQQKLVIQSIISRHIKFRDALIDPLNPLNIKIIEDHQSYFWDPNVVENGQIRGPQVHLSQMMYQAFGAAGNGIQHSNLSGTHLGGLCKVIKPITAVYVPNSGSIPSNDSFKQGIEFAAARMASSVFQKDVYVSFDDPNNFPLSQSYMISDMPKSQVYGDFCVVYNITASNIVYVQTDGKQKSLGSVIKTFEPSLTFNGTTDLIDELDSMRNRARDIILSQNGGKFSNIHHVDSQRNTFAEKYAILSQVKASGQVTDAVDILGITKNITNRHNDS